MYQMSLLHAVMAGRVAGFALNIGSEPVGNRLKAVVVFVSRSDIFAICRCPSVSVPLMPAG